MMKGFGSSVSICLHVAHEYVCRFWSWRHLCPRNNRAALVCSSHHLIESQKNYSKLWPFRLFSMLDSCTVYFIISFFTNPTQLGPTTENIFFSHSKLSILKKWTWPVCINTEDLSSKLVFTHHVRSLLYDCWVFAVAARTFGSLECLSHTVLVNLICGEGNSV